MKKLLTLLLAAGMVVSAANGASAVEMKVSGNWLTSFSFTNNLYGEEGLVDYKKGDSDGSGHFNAAQRVRINFDMVASESLSGRVQLQAGNGQGAPLYYTWGEGKTGGSGKAVTARLAYLDWMIPTTDVLVRMGRQTMAMPSYTFASPVFDSVIDGVMVNAPINDMVGVTVGWLRPGATLNKWDSEYTPHSSIDLAYLSVDVAADGFKVTPWGMIGFAGSNAAKGITWNVEDNDVVRPDSSYFGAGGTVVDMEDRGAFDGDGKPYLLDADGNRVAAKYVDSRTLLYWVGIGGELTIFDPFKFTADFIYSGNDADGYAERDGWYAALGAEMKTSFATPFVKGWYASGDDADSRGSNRMLTLNDGGAFDASSIYFDANGLLSPTIDRCDPSGTWGVQAGVKNVSFIEDLTHALSVTYFQGTNNTNRLNEDSDAHIWLADKYDVNYMTTKDSAWSIDFLSSYKLYQNLTANLLLSYLITDFDEGIRLDGDTKVKFDNAFRGTLNFTYAF
ncbi:MAG: hypothetical protein DBY37_02900 [Desulfovibrionaceae bacterium]|nr:MAG: hypothetical protein DBY37_02900 [Desulfovibrionaceae bacterium]